MLLHSVLRADAGGDGASARVGSGDWDEMVRQARAWGLVPLLYRRLRGRGECGGDRGAAVPAHIEAGLREDYYRGAARNARLYRRLLEVLGAMRDAGIPVIALKGLHLAEIVYGNVALRSMGDADVLVRKSDLARAVAALRAIGFRPVRDLDPDAVCAVSHHLPPLVRADAPAIEIHWHICWPESAFTISLDGLWRRAEPAGIGGAAVLVLSPVDLLLHLCLHAAFQHRFDIGPRVLYDIAATVRHRPGGPDWDELIGRAFEWRATKPAYLMLRLARDVVGADVPADVLDALDPGDVSSERLACASEGVLALRDRVAPPSENLTRVWATAGVRSKVAQFLRYALPPRAVMAGRYPVPADSWRVYAYYPVRIKDLFVRHGASAWRLLRREAGAVAAAGREDRVNALVDWLATPPAPRR